MKGKSIITMVLAVAMTAVLAIGGTMAYMSSKTSIQNTFTVGSGFITDNDGHQGIFLDEEKVGTTTGERTDRNQTYEKLLPGSRVKKDPTANMVGGSVASYVFVKVEGVDALQALKKNGQLPAGGVAPVQCFFVEGWNSQWVQVEAATPGGKDGYYLYRGPKQTNDIVDVTAEAAGSKVVLSEIFASVRMNPDLVQLPSDNEVSKVTISAIAVQAGSGTTYTDGLAAAKALP